MFLSRPWLLSAALLSSLAGLGQTAPASLEERQAAAPVAGTPTVPITVAPPAIPAPYATFGCVHTADPNGLQGFCPSVAATGWCVCSDSSTYGIKSGPNPCGHTAPPLAGPTKLAKENCDPLTAAVPTPRPLSSSRKLCSQKECPKHCGLLNSAAKRSVIEEEDEQIHAGLSKRFFEDPNVDQFTYQLLEQRYTQSVCPADPLTNSFIWKSLATRQTDYAAALEGLSGCTTLFVASGKGVFSSHMWESDEANNPPRDLQPANYRATFADLQTALSAHQSDLAGGEAFLIIPTDPDRRPTRTNPNNYLYGVTIVNALIAAVKTATGGIDPAITTYDPLDFDSDVLGTNRRGTASFQFDPKYTVAGRTTRAYRVISEGNVLALRTGI